MGLLASGCVPLLVGGAVGYSAAPKSPQVVVNTGQPAPATVPPAAGPTKCETGWYATRQGYCCPLGYDDAGNGTCNPSQAVVEAAAAR